jgi:outer membrane receptor for ferrienterochelin and colicins
MAKLTDTCARPRKSRARFAAMLTGCILSGIAFGQEQGQGLDDLLQLLEQETELATQTKQNADYVPGTVSVLQADEMRLLGARTALDAIALVPGLDVQRNRFGAATIRTRSVDFFFNAGNIKVLVDGLPISREAAFQSSAVLLMPIEQLERIEVIRGPGSGVHGDFAYMGLINLVTRHDGNIVGLNVGSGSRTNAYGVFRLDNEQNDFHFSGNASDWRSDRYDTSDGKDNDERRSFLNLRAAWGDFGFKLVALDRDFSGLVPIPRRAGQPPLPDPFSLQFQRERSYNAELRRDWHGEGDDRGALWFQHQYANYEREDATFEGPRDELGGNLIQRWGRHLVLAQLQVAQVQIDHATDLGAGPNPVPILANESRRMTSLTLQDQIDLRDNVQLTAGLRWDDLDGIDSALTPRIAALWQVSDHHLLKAQYAEGFRSPTYQESYVGDTQRGPVDFERVRSSEISYIYRTPRTVFRATGFSHKIDHMIFPVGVPIADSKPEIDGQGVEFELTRQWTPWLRTLASWSTANAMDGRSAYIPVGGQPAVSFGAPSVGQPEELGNLSLLFGEGRTWSGGIHWQHVGRRANRGIEALEDGYDLLNLGLTYRPEREPRLRVDFGVRNALEERVTYLETGTTGLVRDNYPDRLWSIGLSWEFGGR